MPRPTGMTFLGLAVVLLVAAILPAAAGAVTLEELLAMTPEERKAAKADLTAAQKKQLHQEFRALAPAAQEEAAKTLLPHRGATANSRGSRAAVGTVSYDTGVAHGFRVATDEVVVGNRFSTPFMGAPHTLTTVTFQLAGNFSSEGILLVFGAPVGATAPVLDQFTLSGFPVNTLISTPLPGGQITGLTGDFLAGVLQSGSSSTITTTYVGVAVDINDAGAGFHGMSIVGNTMGTIPATLGTALNTSPTVVTATGVTPGVPFNAIVRMTGNNLPVELMSFTVDQD